MKEYAPVARFSFGYFFFFAIYGVASPYLQLLVRGLGYSPGAVGLILGVFEVAGIAGPLVISHAMDRLSRYRPIVFAMTLLIIAAPAPLVLFPTPLVSALSIAALAIGLKTLQPVMDASALALCERPSTGSAGKNAYGIIRAAGSAGFLLMTLILQSLPGFDRSAPARIALWIAASAGLFFLVVFTLPESHSQPRKKAGRAYRDADERKIARRFDPVFVLGIGIIALGRVAMSPISSFLSLYIVEEIKWNAVAGLWALAAVSEIPLILFSGILVRKIGAMRAIAFSTIAIALRLAILAIFPSHGGVVVAQLLHSLCFGLFHPAAVTFVSLRVPPERRALGMAIYLGFGNGLPNVLGASLGGFVIESHGYGALFASFIVFALAAMMLYWLTRRRFAERTVIGL